MFDVRTNLLFASNSQRRLLVKFASRYTKTEITACVIAPAGVQCKQGPSDLKITLNLNKD